MSEEVVVDSRGMKIYRHGTLYRAHSPAQLAILLVGIDRSHDMYAISLGSLL